MRVVTTPAAARTTIIGTTIAAASYP